MKLIDAVEKAIAEGHRIKYRKRKDGGITVTEIDGQRYSGNTSGNRELRRLTGVEMSERQKAQREAINREVRVPKDATERQRKRIREKAKERKHHRKGSERKDAELEKEIRKTQRIWRNNIDITKEGRITARKIRYIAETQGREAAMRALRKYQAYAKGIAYEENVKALAERFEMVVIRALRSIQPRKEIREALDESIKAAEDVKSKILSRISSFKEEWIQPCNSLLYDADKNCSVAGDDEERIKIMVSCAVAVGRIIMQ